MAFGIVVRTRFEGFHQWKEAPEEVAFLRELHRHEFHVEVFVEVTHHNRDVEFILLKRQVNKLIEETQATLADRVHLWSCERWAEHIGTSIDGCTFVAVSEDGENGGYWRA